MSTFALYSAVGNEPVQFGLAAGIGWTLVGLIGVALFAQRRAMRGRSYQVLSGRTRPYVRIKLRPVAQAGALAAVSLFFVVALGVPVVGAISASLLKSLGTATHGFALTFENYTRVIKESELYEPLLYSLRLAAITATVVMALSVPAARLLTKRGAGLIGSTLDLVLLGAVAVPSIVMAAGYILIWNLPVMHAVGISLYGTTALLSMAYVAGALPNNARILIGPLAQLHESLLTSARTHGVGNAVAWMRVALPVLSRYITWVWLYCFSVTLLELPISQLLYPASSPPISIAIERRLENYDFAGGTAIEVISVLGLLAVAALVLLGTGCSPRADGGRWGRRHEYAGRRRCGRASRAEQALRRGAGARRRLTVDLARALPGAPGAVGVGQVDADPLPGRDRASECRVNRDRRPACRRSAHPHAPRAPRPGDGLPGLRPVPHMSVLDNVRFALRRRRISRGDSQDRAQRMLDRVGLAHKRDRYPHELSGGEQQRVALARALVGEPRLLLFDEPLSSLDASLRERLRIEIGTLVRECGASAVYITHDQSEAFALGDEVGVLQAGRLIQIGAPEEIYRRPAAAFVARFTGLAGSLGGRLLGTAEDLSQPPAETDAGQATQRVRVAVPTDQPGRNLELEATAMAKLSPGAAVEVLIRPTAARICGLGKPATLLAMVRDVAYCGRGYEYVLELGAEVELTGVFDARRLQRGEHCAIALDPEGCLVFGQEEPAAPQSLPFDALPGGAEQTHSQGEGSRESEPIARLTR